MTKAISARRGAGLPSLRAVADAAPRPLLLVAADPPKYTMIVVNPAHARAFGTTPAALEGLGVLEVFPADPSPETQVFLEAIRVSFETVLTSAVAHQMPTLSFAVTTPDGRIEDRFWAGTNAPVFDDEGDLTHILSAAQDVTGEVLEQRAEETRQLLFQEADHRARNAMAVIQSFIRLTGGSDVESFRGVLDGRVEALARAQIVLAAGEGTRADLSDVVYGELSGIFGTERCDLAGPSVPLAPDDAQAMGLAIHELATNATKYGALSTASGRLQVTWTWEHGRLNLTWRETGGPQVTKPQRKSFGSRLIEQLGRNLQGRIEFDWRPEGLVVEMRLRPKAG